MNIVRELKVKLKELIDGRRDDAYLVKYGSTQPFPVKFVQLSPLDKDGQGIALNPPIDDFSYSFEGLAIKVYHYKDRCVIAINLDIIPISIGVTDADQKRIFKLGAARTVELREQAKLECLINGICYTPSDITFNQCISKETMQRYILFRGIFYIPESEVEQYLPILARLLMEFYPSLQVSETEDYQKLLKTRIVEPSLLEKINGRSNLF